jgi:hypothetical protein
VPLTARVIGAAATATRPVDNALVVSLALMACRRNIDWLERGGHHNLRSK